MRTILKALLAASSVMMASGIAKIFGQSTGPKMPRFSKHYPKMVTSSNDEISIYNMGVNTRQVRRRITRPWKQGATA